MGYYHKAECGAAVRAGKSRERDLWMITVFGACDDCGRLIEKSFNDNTDDAFEELYWHLGMDKMGFLVFPRPYMRFVTKEKVNMEPDDGDYIYDGPIPPRYGMTPEEVDDA